MSIKNARLFRARAIVFLTEYWLDVTLHFVKCPCNQPFPQAETDWSTSPGLTRLGVVGNVATVKVGNVTVDIEAKFLRRRNAAGEVVRMSDDDNALGMVRETFFSPYQHAVGVKITLDSFFLTNGENGRSVLFGNVVSDLPLGEKEFWAADASGDLNHFLVGERSIATKSEKNEDRCVHECC